MKQPNIKRTGLLLAVVLLIEGFISLSSEVIAIRQISVFAGTSIDVVSVIIGIYLLALACGYASGGQLRRGIRRRLVRNLLVAGIGYAVVFSLALLWLLDDLLDARWPFVLIVSLFGVFPIGYVTSQTLPLLTNYMRRGHIAHVSSRVLFLSTAGSVAASVIVPVVLMQWIGVAATVRILACLIAITTLLLARRHIVRFAAIGIAIATFLLNPIHPTWHKGATVLHVASDNTYATTSVKENAEGRTLLVNRSISSMLPANPASAHLTYLDMLRQIIATQGTGLDILVIGAGGFSISEGDEENHYTHVDINPDLKQIAEQKFLKHPIRGRFIAKDAFVWLQHTKEKFDMVILDAYQTKTSVPPLLTTAEFYAMARDHTAENGWVVANIIVSEPPTRRDRIVDATLRRVFAYCHNWPSHFGRPQINVIYACTGKDDGSNRINTLDRFYSLSD